MTKFKLHVLDLGQLRLRSEVLVGPGPGSGPGPFPELVMVPVSAYCVDHPDGKVLFDTGCHPQAMGPEGRWSQASQQNYPHTGGETCALPNRLEQIGLGPDDFRYVVLSHMHFDHAGCVEFFRKSQIIVHAAEYAAAVDAHRHREDYAYAWRDTDAWIRAGLDWRPVRPDESDLDIHPGVRILNLGRGHTAGMLGLALTMPDSGRIILASDALYCAENFAQPAVLPGWMEDRDGYLRTAARIRNLAGDDAQVWFGHDPRQFATLRKSEEGWYE